MAAFLELVVSVIAMSLRPSRDTGEDGDRHGLAERRDEGGVRSAGGDEKGVRSAGRALPVSAVTAELSPG
jgi:hypothetical protein